MALGILMLLLCRSPFGIGSRIVVILAAAAVYGVRRVPRETRPFWKKGLPVGTIASAIFARAARTPIINPLSTSSRLRLRLNPWQQLHPAITCHNLEGWGVGSQWHTGVEPFLDLPEFASTLPTSARNAYLDVRGSVGLLGFIGSLGAWFVYCCLVASKQRSFVYALAAPIHVPLLATSLAQGSIVVEFGLIIFVACCVKAARELSLRTDSIEVRTQGLS